MGGRAGRRLRLPLLLRPRRIQLRGPLLRRLLAPRRRLVALRSLEPLGRILVGGLHVEHAQRAFPGERPRMADQRPDHDFDRYVGQLLDPQLRAPRAGQGRSGIRGDRRHSPLHAGQRGAELGNHVDHEPRPALRILEPPHRRSGVLPQEDERHAHVRPAVVHERRLRIPLGQHRRDDEPRRRAEPDGHGHFDP